MPNFTVPAVVQVKYPPAATPDAQASALGRNGRFKVTALSVLRIGDKLVLQPVTSRHVAGRCDIELPMDKHVLLELATTLNATAQAL